jgi:uncharacterized protein with ParB-like and HNH nuclease domain
MVKFSKIPKFTQIPAYKVDICLEDFKRRVEKDIQEKDLQLNPDFQRGHIWTQEQQIKYVEYILRGGQSGRDFYFNHQGWFRDWKGEYVCVDGLQRITALLEFLNDKIPVFGHYLREYDEALPMRIQFQWHINDLQNKADVLTWYLEMNEGGTPHTKEELDRVRKMIETV